MPTPIIDIKQFFDRHNGLQRDNRFSVSFEGLPQGLPSLGEPGNSLKTAMVEMGTRAMDTVADNLIGYGPGRMVPRYQKFPGGVLLTIPVTNDHHATNFFNAWFNLLYGGGRLRGALSSPFQLTWYHETIYPTKMIVDALDPNGNVNRKFTFFEVYPMETIPFQFSMENNNQFLKYSILMNYREFSMSEQLNA
jgi:hypothetical protein